MVASSIEGRTKTPRRDINKERESEMAAIWGSEKRGEMRFPKRRGGGGKNLVPGADAPIDMDDLVEDDDDAQRNEGNDGLATVASKKAKAKKDASKKAKARYRLHCFVESGTNINDVREVFEQYEPKVELKTSQKGNLLNKVHYAILTFRNKAMALHAVQQLDGTNQRDRLGVTQLKLSMQLTRLQNKMARKKARHQLIKDLKAKRMQAQDDEEAFVRRFMETHTK